MKVLVLSSGGIDSTVCLALAVEKYGYENVLSLSVSYGQKHSNELKAAQRIAQHYHVRHKELDMGMIFAGSDCTLLEGRAHMHPSFRRVLENRFLPMFRSGTGCFWRQRRLLL